MEVAQQVFFRRRRLTALLSLTAEKFLGVRACRALHPELRAEAIYRRAGWGVFRVAVDVARD